MVTLKELFREKRFPLGWKLVPIIIYFPLGIFVATLRIFIAAQAVIAASLLSEFPLIRLNVLRIMCAIMGIYIFKENPKAEDESVKVIVSNNVSILDHLGIYLLKNSVSVHLPELPSFLHLTLNYRNLGNQRDHKSLIQKVRDLIDSNVRIDIQPEMSTTSGQKGLLRFAVWPCKLNHPIQPVVIRVWRPPFVDVYPSTINASWYLDVFWFFFVPFTVFKLKFIPVIKPLKDETPEEMSKRLENAIADDLKIETTNFKVTDKMELRKRLLLESRANKASSRLSSDPHILEMASKVKEILPDIPINVICRDLARTKSVDLTITNFLEGLVRYTPEKNMPSVSSAFNILSENRKSSLNGTQPSTSFDTSSKTFHKSAQERMISFQERKLRLIQNARQRYLDKHGLNIMNSS